MVLLETGTPDTSREIYNEDADDGTRTRNPSVINRGIRSQPQLRNIVMQYTNWINSTPSQQQLLSCLAQWLNVSCLSFSNFTLRFKGDNADNDSI